VTGSADEPDNHWKLKKEISVGDLAAFASAAIAVVYAYATLDKRIAIVEGQMQTQNAAQKDVDRRQDEEHFRAMARIEQALRDVAQQLEKLRTRQ
jgi:cell division protein ZapA (FtsZ GTPase activity inhibitor)